MEYVSSIAWQLNNVILILELLNANIATEFVVDLDQALGDISKVSHMQSFDSLVSALSSVFLQFNRSFSFLFPVLLKTLSVWRIPTQSPISLYDTNYTDRTGTAMRDNIYPTHNDVGMRRV